MVVRRYKVFLKGYEDKFNRVMLIKDDFSLKEIGTMMLVCLGAEFEHPFSIVDEEGVVYSCEENDYKKHNLYNINVKKTLSFVIKYGEKNPYEFVVKMEKDPFSKSGRKVAYVESGVGESLWENEKDLLEDYMDGKEVNKKDKEDFDQKLNLSFYNQYLVYNFTSIINEIK
ncbi:MAG: hypothetical protein ACI4U5_02185 [Bacilli bacterium]